jgi:RNA polymerase sigma factor (sigma-70 family)
VSAETQKKRIATFIASEWHRLVGFVRAWIADAADRDAEDVVQDVIEGLFEKADVTEAIADLSAYLYRSLRNRVIDLYRAKRPSMAELAEEVSDSRYDVGEELDQAEARETLFSAINALPDAQREVLVATEMEGRSYRDLAAEWDTPIGTLLARKHRAIRSLRKTLTGGTI